MIETGLAIMIAYQAVSQQGHYVKGGYNIFAEPLADHIEVRFVDSSPSGQTEKLLPGFAVQIDAAGKITSLQAGTFKASPYASMADSNKAISGINAYEAALAALKGHENYGKKGKLSVELAGDVYRVTFPLPEQLKPGQRGPDYAYQIWVDALTGKIVKILIAS